MVTTDQNSAGKRIKSTETMFNIVELIRSMDDPTVTELSSQLNKSKSTVYTHLNTLQDRGLVVKQDKRYCIGLQFYDYGMYAKNQHDVLEVVQPHIEQLAEQTDETAWFVVEENGKAVFLHKEADRPGAPSIAEFGTHVPVHATASGRAMLASQPREHAEKVISQHGLTQITENTITQQEELLDNLEQIREKGYAYNSEETAKGMAAVATAIEDTDGVQGAISVSGAASRLSRQRCETEIRDHLLSIKSEVQINSQSMDRHF